jgi:divalent metal cation (Fe/Co/Zn/Cd) transporter
MATRSSAMGYGRAEDLAGIIVVLLIAASAFYAGYVAIQRFVNPERSATWGCSPPRG